MSTNISYSIDQMKQLADALKLGGFTPDDVTKLRNFSDLKALKELVNGRMEIGTIKHIINCSIKPYIPDGWSIHLKDQLPNRVTVKDFEFNPKNLFLYTSDKQKQGYTEGNKIKKELKDKPVLTANVLDYLLKHPELIPKKWEGNSILFWGTIYRYSDGSLAVHSLYRSSIVGVEWDRGCRSLGHGLSNSHPAVCAKVA